MFTVQAKLMAMTGATILLMGVVGWIGVDNLARQSDLTGSMYRDQLLPTAGLGQASQSLLEIRMKAMQEIHLLAGDATQRAQVAAEAAASEQRMLGVVDTYAKATTSAEERAQMSRFESA